MARAAALAAWSSACIAARTWRQGRGTAAKVDATDAAKSMTADHAFDALVGVRITRQGYDSSEPWKKRYVRTSTLRGVLVQPHTVLIPGRSVKDHLTIEVTVANSARRYSAKLKHHDRRPRPGTDRDHGSRAARDAQARSRSASRSRLDDEFDVYQLGQDNMVERYTATVARANAYSTRLTLRCKTTLSDSGNGQACVKDGEVSSAWSPPRTGRGRRQRSSRSRRCVTTSRTSTTAATTACPGSGPWTFGLLRDDLRAYYGLVRRPARRRGHPHGPRARPVTVCWSPAT